MESNAAPEIAAQNAGAGPCIERFNAKAASDANAGAPALTHNAAAAKPQLAASSPARATLPSRLARAIRRGVASKGLSSGF